MQAVDYTARPVHVLRIRKLRISASKSPGIHRIIAEDRRTAPQTAPLRKRAEDRSRVACEAEPNSVAV